MFAPLAGDRPHDAASIPRNAIPPVYPQQERISLSFLKAMQLKLSPFWSPEVESIVLAGVKQLLDGSMEERLALSHQREIRAALWEDRALNYHGKVSCPLLLVPAAAQPLSVHDMPEKLERAEEFSAAKGYMAAQVARAIRRCTVLWMPDTAHDIHLHRPQHLADAILDFVRRPS